MAGKNGGPVFLTRTGRRGIWPLKRPRPGAGEEGEGPPLLDCPRLRKYDRVLKGDFDMNRKLYYGCKPPGIHSRQLLGSLSHAAGKPEIDHSN